MKLLFLSNTDRMTVLHSLEKLVDIQNWLAESELQFASQ